MTLHEPSTFLTDLALSGLCLFLWHKLPPAPGPGLGAGKLHRISFLSLAASALAGGLVHGVGHLVDPAARQIVWNFSQVSGCVWAYLIALGGVAEFRDAKARRFVTVFLTIKLLVMVAVAASDGRFIWVVAESASSLVIAGFLALQRWLATGEPRYRRIGQGVVLSFAGAAVQVAGFDLYEQFNHNDIFHVVLMLAVWCFYRAWRPAAVSQP